MSGGSEQVNGRENGPVLQSVFLAVIDHSEGYNISPGIKVTNALWDKTRSFRDIYANTVP